MKEPYIADMKERILIWITWKLPKSLVYWCAIRLMTYNFTGSPCSRTCTEALKGWDTPMQLKEEKEKHNAAI